MGRYPRAARDAQVKCIDCNAPVVTTVDGRYVCVSCGESPIASNSENDRGGTSAASVQASVASDGSTSVSNSD